MPELTPRYIAVVRFLHQFPNTTAKDYEFLCNQALQEGDVVVADTVNGLQLARLVGVKKTSSAATKWIIQKVDLAEHQARIEAEERLKELQMQMKKRANELQEITVYQKLAEADPKMAAMVAEYQSLGAQQLAWETKQSTPAVSDGSSYENHQSS